MVFRRIDDWTALQGALADIRVNGVTVCSGTVDAVTEDGSVLWIQPTADQRKLYERGSCEAWATDERLGFHYRLAMREMQPR